MSRLKNFSRNLATSYLQLGVNVVYSLASVPLILHYLPKAEFGLWAVLVQLMSYLSLLDLGMTGAVARLLVDHKDDRTNGVYGSFVKTAILVSLTQALIILALVLLGAPVLAAVMHIPLEYRHTFILLMQLQGLIMAFSFSSRPLGIMLYAHQRMDVQSFNDILSLIAQLGLLIFFLHRGSGIYSFIYANIFTALASPVFMAWNCRRFGLVPRSGEWGAVSWQIFREVFDYGKNVFIMGLGVQLIMASQVILISRTLGLELAASWSVGTKIFNLFSSLMCRPYGAALPGLYEMAARNEAGRLRKRFHELVILTGSLGVFLGVSLALCNSLFVTVWTGAKIHWSPWNDVSLGLWLFLSSLQTTHINFVSVSKQFGGAKFIYLLEGGCFVIIALLLGGRGGILGILVAANICQLLFSCQYGIRLSSRYFKCHWTEVAFGWVLPCLKFAAAFAPLAVVAWLVTAQLPIVWRLVVHAAVGACLGGFIFLKLGFPRQMLFEIETRLPRPAARILQLLAGPAKLPMVSIFIV
jgi:O-antigen/teichoic acid export membrane protein